MELSAYPTPARKTCIMYHNPASEHNVYALEGVQEFHLTVITPHLKFVFLCHLDKGHEGLCSWQAVSFKI